MFTDFDSKLKVEVINTGGGRQKPYEQCNLEITKVEVTTARKAGMILKKRELMDNPCIVFHIKDYDLTGEVFTVNQLCFINKDGLVRNPIQKGYTNAKTGVYSCSSTAYDLYKAIVLANKDKLVDLELLDATDPKKYVGYKFRLGLKTAISKDSGKTMYFLETEFQKSKDAASYEAFEARDTGPVNIPGITTASQPVKQANNVGINPGDPAPTIYDDEANLPDFLKSK